MIRSLAAAASLLLIAGAASAQDVDCDNAASQYEMNFCADKDYQDADKELNAVWKQAKAKAKEMDAEYSKDMQGAQQALLDGQRGWIAYRDGQCVLEGWEAHGGTMEPMLVSGCLATLTRARTKELNQFIKGIEGQ